MRGPNVNTKKMQNGICGTKRRGRTMLDIIIIIG